MQPLILNWYGPIELQVFEETQASSVSSQVGLAQDDELKQKTTARDVPPTGSRVVYLWCIRIVGRGEDHWAVYYVGSTQQFRRRMRDHCNNWVGGNYSLFDPEDADRGEINILYIPGYGEWQPRLEKVARENLSRIKLFWAEVVGDWNETQVEGALRIKILRKQETRGYHYGQEPASLKLHHDFIKNRFPDGCKVIGFETCTSFPGQL